MSTRTESRTETVTQEEVMAEIRKVLKVLPVVRTTHLQVGRPKLNGRSRAVDAALQRMIADGELMRVFVGSAPAYFEADCALHAADYLWMHGSITQAQCDEIVHEYATKVEAPLVKIATQRALTGRRFIRLMQRMKLRGDVEEYLEREEAARKALEEAVALLASADDAESEEEVGA